MRIRRPVAALASPRVRTWVYRSRANVVAGALAGTAALVVVAVSDVVLGRSAVGAAVPSLTWGAMVTIVGPLGVTFPCWAALHWSGRATAG